ncbi:MAG TPA: aldehyde dehydrogenase family protein [Candidatus Elarobacter sp.]
MEVGVRPLPIDVATFDHALDELRANAASWARLGFAGKIRHLRAMRARTIEVADEWVALAAHAKGIAGTPLAGEEWFSGPYAVLVAIDRLIATLAALATGHDPYPAAAVRTRAGGQVVVDVFPAERSDRILLSGVRAEVWMDPSVTAQTLGENTASFYRESAPPGGVTLVLGAGNIASIPPLDVLTALYAHGHVALLKLNPVNDYLLPVFERLFSSLIDERFVFVTTGGAAVGAYACGHRAVDAIHLTGGERTHDAIVFGGGDEGRARKAVGDPIVTKPVTSELGNVTPVIVVPGPWSEPDFAFQAAHVATMKLHNAGANCIAAQVLVTPQGWEGTARFVGAVEHALRSAPERPSYYPGSAAERRFAAGLDENADEPLFRDEAFGPVLAQTSIAGDDAGAFLRNAVAFCNDRLRGTLGVSVLVHPRTIAALGPAFEEAVAALRYGCVAINTWPGVGFLLPAASWGAYPGNTLAAVGSGIGIVHNAYLFDRPQKTVVRAPFAPFPRSFGDGENTLLPTPPWFVTHRRADAVGRAMFAFTAKPSPARMLATAVAAMRH